MIFRENEKETKRYDFEAQTAIDAVEIVEEVKRGIKIRNPAMAGL